MVDVLVPTVHWGRYDPNCRFCRREAELAARWDDPDDRREQPKEADRGVTEDATNRKSPERKGGTT